MYNSNLNVRSWFEKRDSDVIKIIWFVKLYIFLNLEVCAKPIGPVFIGASIFELKSSRASNNAEMRHISVNESSIEFKNVYLKRNHRCRFSLMVLKSSKIKKKNLPCRKFQFSFCADSKERFFCCKILFSILLLSNMKRI